MRKRFGIEFKVTNRRSLERGAEEEQGYMNNM